MDERTTDRRSRRLLTLSLLLLSAATAAALGRVFESSTTSRLIAAGALATILAVLLERRHVLLSLLVSAAGLLFLVGWLVFPDATSSGLLPGTTVDRLARALGRLGAQVQDRDIPVPAIPALFAPALLAVWSAAHASHALAARAGSPLLALVPPGAILAFAAVVAEDGARRGYAGVFLAGVLGVLFAARMSRLGSWGRTGSREAATASRAARGLALAAAGVALLVPGILPGFHSGALVKLDGDGNTGIVISPMVDIRPSLRRDDPVELFRVRSPRPAYWRQLSLDRYTGRFWQSTDAQASTGNQLDEGGPLGSGVSAGGELVSQEYRMTELGGPWLPAAYEPRDIDIPGRTIRHDTEGGAIVDPAGIPEGLEYRISSEIQTPTRKDLIRASQDRGLGELDDRAFGVSRYTALPSDTPAVIRRTAQRITRGIPGPYQRALAIQDYFRRFTYDEDAPAGHGTDDMAFFLRSRRGYCEQFAGAMAVFLRSLGYPARVAVGFLPGRLDRTGWYSVTTDDAHAWVEMFFAGYGWLAFEPTPTRANPGASTYLDPTGSLSGASNGGSQGEGLTGELGATGEQFSRLRRQRLPGGGPSGFVPSLPQGERPSLWSRMSGPLLLVALAAAALVFIPAGKALARRVALARARSPAQKVLVAYRVFEAGAADLGMGRRSGETLEEYARRLSAEMPWTGDRPGRMADLAGRAAYSGEELGAESATAPAAARALARDVRSRAGKVNAIRAAVRPTRPL